MKKTYTYMKILVFSDFHGNTNAVRKAVQIVRNLHPDKVVVCGDIFGGWFSRQEDIVAELKCIDAPLYLIRGNNDYPSDELLLPTPLEDCAVMYHFGRTLYFTHGDRYNAWRMPPLLKNGDVLVHGHTHVGMLKYYNGVLVANVGSMALPRDNMPDYLVLDESGATLYDLADNVLQHVDFTAVE